MSKRLSRVVALLGAATWTSLVHCAHAATPSVPDADLLLGMSLGMDRCQCAGVAGSGYLGTEALLRWRLLEAGVGLDWRSLMIWNALGAHAALGVGLPISTIRLDLLAVAGMRHYPHWGRSLLGDAPGASATIPFVGGRIFMSYELRHSESLIALLGITLGYDNDLWRKQISYTYIETPWLDLFGTSEPHEAQGHQNIGSHYWTIAVSTRIAFSVM